MKCKNNNNYAIALGYSPNKDLTLQTFPSEETYFMRHAKAPNDAMQKEGQTPRIQNVKKRLNSEVSILVLFLIHLVFHIWNLLLPLNYFNEEPTKSTSQLLKGHEKQGFHPPISPKEAHTFAFMPLLTQPRETRKEKYRMMQHFSTKYLSKISLFYHYLLRKQFY